MWLVDVSIRRPVFAVMIIGALVVLGIISIGRVGIDLFPNVEFPYVSVTTTLEGASPDTIESEVTDVIEESVNTISSIKQMKSVSAEGISQVFIEFELKEDVNVKAQDVRDKTALARRDLPADIEPPIVEKLDPDAAPILSIVIAGDIPIGRITTFADEIAKETLQRLPGVGSVSLVGGRKRQIRIWLDAVKMRAYGITADDVVRAVRSEHTEIPGGRMEVAAGAREFGVKTKAEAKTPAEFAALVVAYRKSGMATRIGDVARVEDGLEDERTYAQLNGRPGVSLEVRRQSGRNTVQVARLVKRKVEELRKVAPEGLEIIVARDVSRFIESSINDVSHEIQAAMVLVVLITFFFLLSWRATLIVAIAIPTSLISTFFIFGIFGFTINLLTLLALTVSIGLLVDDAIVVIEAIQHDIDAGKSPMTAAAEGTRRVGLAVLAGTFATLAVFVPIAFMEGIVGRFFFQYGLTIVFAVSISLLVALTLTPMLSSRFLYKVERLWLPFRIIESFHRGMETAYRYAISYAVRWSLPVLVLAVGTVIVGIGYAKQVPKGFTAKADRSEFQGEIELPLGFGVTEAKKAARRIQSALKRQNDIRDVFVTVGAGSQAKTNKLDIYVTITPKQQRRVNQFVIMDRARKAIARAMPNATKMTITEVPWISGGGLSLLDVEFVLRGSDLHAMQVYIDALVADLRASNLFVDVRSSFEGGRPELEILFDRTRAGDLGISARSLATTARIMIGGVDAGSFEDAGKRYDVRVRLEEGQRQTPEQLQLIQIRAADGRLIDLASVADIKFSSSPAQIDRQDRARKISLLANASPGVALGTATAKLEELIAKRKLPDGVTTTFEGKVRRMKEVATSIGAAYALAMIALYIVLASQFNSFVQPFIIMLTAPLCLSGAFSAMHYGGFVMSLFAQIGLLALMGIVMKNGILLVDRANQLRAEGMSPREAMIKAGPERLRPVLMTAVSAVFGMIPVLIATSDGAEWRNVMGAIIIGGLASSTLLTLLVVPAAYSLVASIGNAFHKLANRIGKWNSRRQYRMPVPGE
jgi:hydrophobe/amphiphile efflux-1 (HAE1) family protein